MKINLHNPNARKFWLGGAAVVLLALLLYRFLAPVVAQVFTSDEEIYLKVDKLAKYQTRLQEKKALLHRLVASQKKLEQNEATLLGGKTIALAAVEIQKMLIDITDKTGVDIMSIRILPTRDIDNMPYQAVPVQITVSSTIGQLINALHAINSSNRLLHTPNFNIRSSGLQNNEKIQTALTVEGLMKKVENQQE